MKQLTQVYKTGEIQLVDVPAPALRPSGVLVQTAFSLISAGTERTKVTVAKMSLLGKARARPDLVRQVLAKVRQEGIANTWRKVQGRLEEPSPLGYSSAGVVVAAGADAGLQVGQRVACAGAGFANHAEVVFVPKNLCVPVPEGVRVDQAAAATVGAIALQGLRQADARLGETVAVIGLGLLGQIAVQLFKAQGCRVVAIDIDAHKVDLAIEHGAELGEVRGRDEVVRAVEQFTGGLGCDAVVIMAATSSNDPMVLAGEIARDRGRVVVVGTPRLDVPRDLYYRKELDVRLSRSYGPGRYDPSYEERGVDYPVGYVRWTERRQLAHFLELIQSGRVRLDRIITHRLPFEQAGAAYDLIRRPGSGAIGVLLEYASDPINHRAPVILANGSSAHLGKNGAPSRPALRSSAPAAPRPATGPGSPISIGLIGAGNFARGTLLPLFRKSSDIRLRAVATASGLSARSVADRFGFERCVPEAADVLADPEVQAVVIATRHDTHAALAAEAMALGKAVFVEKPLAITFDQLRSVALAQAQHGGRCLVGLNRRFAPLVREVRAFFGRRAGPMTCILRANAGPLPPDHWIHQLDQGGGRVIGEACHFVDLAGALIGAPPVQVFATAAPAAGRALAAADDAAITLTYADGSIATVVYSGSGDLALGKERIECFADGKAASIEDFRTAQLAANGKIRRLRGGAPDKGHPAEVTAFLESLRVGGQMPIPFADILHSHLATLGAVHSLVVGAPVAIDLVQFLADEPVAAGASGS